MQRSMSTSPPLASAVHRRLELLLTSTPSRCTIQFKVKGYSKTKNADLVAKLLQYRASLAPDQASTAQVVPQTPQPDHSQPATPSLSLTTASRATPATPAALLSSLNDGFAAYTSGLPTFIDSPYSANSSNLLITPTAPPLRIGIDLGKGPGMNVQSSTAKSQTPSSSALQSSPLIAHSTLYSRPIGSSTLTKQPNALESTSTKIINRNRKEDRSQAATSLKDVVAKQREAKRTAGEAGIANGNGTAKRVSWRALAVLYFSEGRLLSIAHYRSRDRGCGAVHDKRSTTAGHVLPDTPIEIGLEQ